MKTKLKSKDVYREIPRASRPSYKAVNDILHGRRPSATHGNVVAVLTGLEALMNSRVAQVESQFSDVRNRILSVCGGVVSEDDDEQ